MLGLELIGGPDVGEDALDGIHFAFDDLLNPKRERRALLRRNGVFGDLRLGTRLHGRFTGERRHRTAA